MRVNRDDPILAVLLLFGSVLELIYIGSDTRLRRRIGNDVLYLAVGVCPMQGQDYDRAHIESSLRGSLGRGLVSMEILTKLQEEQDTEAYSY